MSLRILSVFATFGVGGPQVRYAGLANAFGAAFRHQIVAMDGNLACRERLDPSLDVTYPVPALRKGDTFGNLRAIRGFLRETRPDVLVTHNWGSIEWAMANALRPLVRHVHIEDGFGPEERDTQLLRRIWTRRLVLRGSRVVLPSQTLLSLARDVWRLPQRGLHYIPNGIDLAGFDAVAAPARGDRLMIGTVAALRPEKNLGRLIEAFALALPGFDAGLQIVGDGPERAALEARTDALGVGDRVVFTGHVPQPAAMFKAFDIFALSSDTEQMPIAVLEAMAASLPVAATQVGDVGLMLACDNQALLCSRDAEALAGSLRRLLADADLRLRVGAANRHKVARDYTRETMLEAYAALLAPFDRKAGG